MLFLVKIQLDNCINSLALLTLSLIIDQRPSVSPKHQHPRILPSLGWLCPTFVPASRSTNTGTPRSLSVCSVEPWTLRPEAICAEYLYTPRAPRYHMQNNGIQRLIFKYSSVTPTATCQCLDALMPTSNESTRRCISMVQILQKQHTKSTATTAQQRLQEGRHERSVENSTR